MRRDHVNATNYAKAAEIGANIDAINRLRERNLKLELEIRLERKLGRPVTIDGPVTREMLRATG